MLTLEPQGLVKTRQMVMRRGMEYKVGLFCFLFVGKYEYNISAEGFSSEGQTLNRCYICIGDILIGIKNIIFFYPFTDVYEAMYTQYFPEFCWKIHRQIIRVVGMQITQNATIMGLNLTVVICMWIFFTKYWVYSA